MSGRRYRFGPLEQRGVIGPLTLGQVAIVGLAAAVGLAAVYSTRSFVGFLFAAAILAGAGAAIFLPVEGRTVEEWAPVALRWFLRPYRSGWRSAVPSAGIRAGRTEGAALSLPPELNDIELVPVPYGSEEVGVVVDRRAATYTAAIAVRAGAFSLRDSGEQEWALEAWGDVLSSCAREGSALRRLQWIERTLPGQGDELAAYLQEKRDRSIPRDANVVSSYIELLEAAAPVTQEHEVLIALQIDTRRAARDLKRLGGGREGAFELLLREAENFSGRLADAEVDVFGLLRPRQYAEVIRDAFDPFGHQARARSAIGDPEREGVDPSRMGPIAEEEEWSHYRTDSAYHHTYWISSLPRSDVGPTFLSPLLMQSAVVRTVSFTFEPVPYSVAMRRAEMAQTAEVADEIARGRQGFLTTARNRRQQSAATRREEELAEGFAEFRGVGFVTSSVRELELLERSKAAVEHASHLSRLELQPMYGEQAAGFANTLPLCRGLK